MVVAAPPSDMFRGEDVSKLALSGLDNVSSFTLIGESVLVRHYTIQLRKSGTKVKRDTRHSHPYIQRH